jgi:hypothetical protein
MSERFSVSATSIIDLRAAVRAVTQHLQDKAIATEIANHG